MNCLLEFVLLLPQLNVGKKYLKISDHNLLIKYKHKKITNNNDKIINKLLTINQSLNEWLRSNDEILYPLLHL